MPRISILEFKEKNRRRRLLYSRAAIVFLILCVLFAFHNLAGVYAKYTEATEKYKKSRGELAALEAKDSQLEKNVARLHTPRGVEEEIREKFMVSMDGEGVIFLVDGEDTSKEMQTEQKQAEDSWWREFLQIFGMKTNK